MSANDEVRLEMQAFLKALESYPERAARDPDITFEQHHTSLMRPSRANVHGPSSRRARKL